MNKYISYKKNSDVVDNLSSVSMLFNGQYLEELIDGYMTLNVFGREMIDYDIDAERRNGGDGVIRFSKSLPPRTLEIEYQLLSDTPEEQQTKYNKLMQILSTKNIVPIKFRDEPDFEFTGEYQSSEKVDSKKLNIVSSFSILCPDPFKYKSEIKTTGIISVETIYETYPSRINILIPAATNLVTVSNTLTKKVIRLQGEIGANSNIELDVINQTIKINGQLRNDLIVLNSDFENFEIRKGDTITTNVGTIEVYQREKML